MADYSKLNRHSETWCPIPFVGLASYWGPHPLYDELRNDEQCSRP